MGGTGLCKVRYSYFLSSLCLLFVGRGKICRTVSRDDELTFGGSFFFLSVQIIQRHHDDIQRHQTLAQARRSSNQTPGRYRAANKYTTTSSVLSSRRIVFINIISFISLEFNNVTLPIFKPTLFGVNECQRGDWLSLGCPTPIRHRPAFHFGGWQTS